MYRIGIGPIAIFSIARSVVLRFKTTRAAAFVYHSFLPLIINSAQEDEKKNMITMFWLVEDPTGFPVKM